MTRRRPVPRLFDRVIPATVALGACALLAGCSGGGNTTAAAATSTDFYTAVQAQRFQEACDLLAQPTREELTESEQLPCPEALASIGLSSSHIEEAHVYGRKAIVHLDNDNAFLAHQNGEWKITAAGCEAQPDRPYDCELEAN